MFTFDIDGIEALEAACPVADAVLVEGIRDAVRQGAELAVVEAMVNHPYQDQTGKLTRSIRQTTRDSSGGATATIRAGAGYAKFVEEGTAPHEIRAKSGGVLAWNGPDGPAFARVVQHPGTQPLPFLAPAAQIGAEQIMHVLETIVVPSVKKAVTGG